MGAAYSHRPHTPTQTHTDSHMNTCTHTPTAAEPVEGSGVAVAAGAPLVGSSAPATRPQTPAGSSPHQQQQHRMGAAYSHRPPTNPHRFTHEHMHTHTNCSRACRGQPRRCGCCRAFGGVVGSGHSPPNPCWLLSSSTTAAAHRSSRIRR